LHSHDNREDLHVDYGAIMRGEKSTRRPQSGVTSSARHHRPTDIEKEREARMTTDGCHNANENPQPGAERVIFATAQMNGLAGFRI
jgi:hypothetical protein